MHESIWYNFTITPPNQNNKIEPLQPNTLYVLKVIAINEIGISKPSLEITVKTLQEGNLLNAY